MKAATRVARALIDKTLVRLLGYIRARLPTPQVISERPGVVTESFRRAVRDSADYADAYMAEAMAFADIVDLRRHAFANRRADGLIVEFGVWQAHSINFFASISKEQIFGFDSFEGLKEDWKGWHFPKGAFDLGGKLPQVAANVSLVAGWFEQSLPRFLADHGQPFSFVHIDCDTYEATSTVLCFAADRFVPGTVVVFDEYFGFRGWRIGEFKAWREFVARCSLKYRYLGFSNEAVSVTII
jgi:hypothetical protein